MNTRRARSLALRFAALAVFAACGDNLIADPSFDLWCGDALCAPWETTGQVSRVKTWHVRDYGVSLGDGSTLSQRSTHDAVSCIEFDVIADVDASAEVWLEMDFRDDGSTEYRQQIPESHWAKLRFLVKTPTWYDDVRFRLKKEGTGRAVLAQIQATPGEDCQGAPIPLDDRPNAAFCESDEQCTSGVCGKTDPALSAFGVTGTCGECSADTLCPAGMTCTATHNELGQYSVCAPINSGGDAGCDDDAGPCP